MNERTRKSLTMLLALVLCLALLLAQAFALDMQVDAPALTVNTSVIGFAGQEWYVIGYDGSGVYSQSNTATLLLKSSGTPYGNTAFRTGKSTQDDPEWTQYTVSGWYYEGEFTQPNDYKDSTLQNRMVAIADGIPGKELALINTRTLTAVDDINYPITGGDVANQKLWPLSYNEWTTIDDDTVRSFGNYFWLRSPSDASGAFAGLLDGGYYSNGFVSSASGAARPAFNLNLASVLFTSAASGASGKSSATAGSGLVGASAPTGALKFTVKSASQELEVTADETQVTQSGATLTFGYTGATAGTNQYVSCVLLNGSDEVAYYGKLADSSSDASGDLSIPLAGVSDGTYTLQIFSEEANGDNDTDFCSEPVSMTLNVSDGVGTVSSFGGTELDATAPVLSAGSVNRAGDTAATIGFTTSEAGTAYYKVVDSGATAPSKEAVAAETSLGAVSGTVSGKSVTLTAGAKDIYVVVKDAAGNISNMLSISIPVYVAPTPPSISPASASYDLSAPDDVITAITLNSASTVTGVVYDAHSLAAGADYTVTGSALTIKDSYLSGLGPSEGDTLVFDISFDTGDSAALTVHVVDSYTPSGDADLSDLAVGGSTVGGFGADITSYNVELPHGTSPGGAAALVGGAANDPLAQVSVTQASALPGSATVTVTAEDGTIKTYTVNFTLGAAPGTAPTITTTSLPGGRVGSSYNRSLSATGDTPITWTIDSGSLPNGLTLGGSTGVISGTPTARGSFSFTVKATNAVGSVTKELSITINAASTGGGSGGGSSDSGTTVIIQPEKKPDQPVMAGFSATPAVNSSGHATVTVSQKSVADAIAKAQADAKAQGKSANGIGISLNIDLPDTAKSLGIVLPQATLKSLVDAGVKQLEINGVIVSLDLDLEALKEIQKQSTGDVTITLKPVQNLSTSAKKLIGARPVYDMTISYVKDGKTVNITSLGKGSATLSLPYTPNKNEAAGYLFGVYVDGKGNATRIPGSAYDSGSGSIILGTDHFSVYGVGYTAPSEKYTDIATHWASESIDYAVGRGLFSGTTEKIFSPNMAMDRGMLVTVLGRLAGADVSVYKTSSFTDVAAGTYYLPYVEWAYKKGIVQGIGNGKFDPERAVTREEIALILQNYAKATGYTLPVTREASTYADDSSIGSVYKTAITAMQQAGIMMGGSGNRFNPKSGATRAEVAAMLHRYVKLTIDPATAQGWAKNDDGRYMYYKDGKPLTGWQTIDGTRYFFHTNGTLQTGWVKDGDNWRFYSGNKALVGWWDIGSETYKKRYYFDVNAVMVFGKWLQIDGKWYYFYTDGSLAVSTKIGEYEVDEYGVRKTK